MTNPELQALKLELGDATSFWGQWMCHAQRVTMLAMLRGEEREWFFDRLTELRKIIEGMPQTYETQQRGMQYTAYVKYFRDGTSAWICEKDMGEGQWQPTDPQHQAWGRVVTLPNYPENGYVSLPELLSAGCELDLHFDPTELSLIRREEG